MVLPCELCTQTLLYQQVCCTRTHASERGGAHVHACNLSILLRLCVDGAWCVLVMCAMCVVATINDMHTVMASFVRLLSLINNWTVWHALYVCSCVHSRALPHKLYIIYVHIWTACFVLHASHFLLPPVIIVLLACTSTYIHIWSGLVPLPWQHGQFPARLNGWYLETST